MAVGMAQGSNLRMGNLAKPTKPRIVQILKQVPISQETSERRKSQAQNRQAQHDQQAKDGHRHVPEGMMVDVPIHSLAPLRELNAYRQCLGLGPSKNLISSAIYNYNPDVVADYYDSHPFAWEQLDIGPVVITRSPLYNATSDGGNNQSSSSPSGNTRSPTSHGSNGSGPNTNTPRFAA
ncbi:hypothetical protein O1611_g5139 [Lasiodiplodia mahajangana]|uniref:Uncharacterized protein n=1 Tax=Lasiodiplodia mahajangana TaxID=1108764 RepID=A0ACC2JLW0_9PEZI|nr:hypothetical protein O1611_g5139 [Lasiodiplodia mahajangana]